MFIDEGFFGLGNYINAIFGIKIFLVLFLIFYSIFSLMIFRQVQLMSSTLPTPLSPILKFIAIVHVGISLCALFFVIGVF